MINGFIVTKAADNNTLLNLESFPNLDNGDFTIEKILNLVESLAMADPRKRPESKACIFINPTKS